MEARNSVLQTSHCWDWKLQSSCNLCVKLERVEGSEGGRMNDESAETQISPVGTAVSEQGLDEDLQ